MQSLSWHHPFRLRRWCWARKASRAARGWDALSRPSQSSAARRASPQRSFTATSTSTTSNCPITHTFEPIEGGYLNGIAPYAELTLDYLTGDQTFPLIHDANSPSSVKLSFNAWSALAGGGFDVPLGNGFRLRPILLAGYSHVGGDANFFGPNSALFRSLVGGILSNASVNSALLGGALELIYETQLRGDLTFKTQTRYNELAAVVTSASSNALKQNGSFGVANASIVPVRANGLAHRGQLHSLAWLRQGYVVAQHRPRRARLQRLRRNRRWTAGDRSEHHSRRARRDRARIRDRRPRCHRLAGQRRA